MVICMIVDSLQVTLDLSIWWQSSMLLTFQDAHLIWFSGVSMVTE